MNNCERKKIPDLLWFQEGPGVRNTQYTSSGVKLLNVANLVNGKVDLSTSDRYISEEEAYGKYKHFLVDDGDFIIASSGIKVDYFDKKMGFVSTSQLPLCMNTSTIRFKVIDKSILNIRYFMYYLKSEDFKRQLGYNITGSAQLNFGPSHIKKMTIPLVGLNEQLNIIKHLDKTNDIIDKLNNQLIVLDELIKSRFVEMFGDPVLNIQKWIKVPMGNYMSLLTDFSANGSYEYLDSNVVMYSEPNYALMVRTTDLERNDFNNDVKYIDEKAYNILSKSKLFGNEIIMNKIGSAGKVYLMPKLNRPASLGRNAFMFRFKSDINILFLYYLLTSEYGLSEIQQHVRGAVTKTITKDAARSIRIIVPPIELQNQFADFVTQVEKQKATIQQSIDKLETLKKSLMQEYFG